jgi:hypothetical protein
MWNTSQLCEDKNRACAVGIQEDDITTHSSFTANAVKYSQDLFAKSRGGCWPLSSEDMTMLRRWYEVLLPRTMTWNLRKWTTLYCHASTAQTVWNEGIIEKLWSVTVRPPSYATYKELNKFRCNLVLAVRLKKYLGGNFMLAPSGPMQQWNRPFFDFL